MAFIDPTPYTHDGQVVADLLDDLALAAATSLAQTPDGVPAVTGAFHDAPPEDCCDAIQLWVRSYVPVGPGAFPNQATEVERCSHVQFMPDVVLQLRRPCAPIPDADGFVDPALERAIARNLTIDIRALLCGVAATWPPILQANYPGARLFYEPATSAGASTNCLGYDWPIKLEIQGCSAACLP